MQPISPCRPGGLPFRRHLLDSRPCLRTCPTTPAPSSVATMGDGCCNCARWKRVTLPVSSPALAERGNPGKVRKRV